MPELTSEDVIAHFHGNAGLYVIPTVITIASDHHITQHLKHLKQQKS